MATAPKARKAISKKTRFEVFKRDSFKCQYCGKCAPDVILHVDHIHPVSKGGANDLLNYITSCEDCNGGKSDRLLSDDSVMAKQRAQLEELNERREQLEQMLAWREGLLDLGAVTLQAAVDAWEKMTPGFRLNELGEKDLKSWIKKYGIKAVMDAMDTCEQYINKGGGRLDPDNISAAFKKIPGVARMSLEPEWKRELFYLRGIARNRFRYVDERQCIDLLRTAYESGVDIDKLRSLTLSVNTWSQWLYGIEELMGAK